MMQADGRLSPRAMAVMRLVLLLVAAWAYLYRLDTPALLGDPNEAKCAEVAREMIESGDWISPRLNYVLFLNKPPLSFWLIALSFRFLGVNDFAARLPGALTMLVLVFLTGRLGAALWGATAGLWSMAVMLATVSLLVEARVVGPDPLLTTAIVGALLAATYLARAPGDYRARWALQVALAVGLLAKGFLGLFVPAGAVTIAMLASRNFDIARALATPRAWWLFLVLVLPWHLAVALRHTGFAWDYVVNQHVFAFLGSKLPLDPQGITVGQFWLAFGLRLFPWTLFLPVAVFTACRRARREDEPWPAGLLLGWIGTVLLLFSATPSRLEHYSIPALPGCVLLLGGLFQRAHQLPRATLAVHVLILSGGALLMPWILPNAVARLHWLHAPGLPHLARVAGVFFAVGCAFMAAFVISPKIARPVLAPIPLIVTMCAWVPLIPKGLAMIAPHNSSARLAAVINEEAAESDILVYEAPVEYQTGAGLFFYTGRKWWILRPPGYVPPLYLAPHEAELFISYADLQRYWDSRRVFVVSDPLKIDRQSMNGVVPEPFREVARIGNRWVVSNR